MIDSAKDGLTGKEFGEPLQRWAFGTPATHRVAATMSPFPTFTVEGRSVDFLAYYSLSRIVLVLGLSLSPVLRFDVAPRTSTQISSSPAHDSFDYLAA